MPWLDQLPLGDASPALALDVQQVVLPPAARGGGRIVLTAAMIAMLLDPQGPNDVSPGWCCIAFSTLALLLPGGAGILFGIRRLFFRRGG